MSTGGNFINAWRRLSWLLAVSLLSFGFVLYGLLTTPKLDYQNAYFGLIGDRHAYIQMAVSKLGEFRLAPYCWRVAVPFLAAHLGLTLPMAFQFINAFSLTASGIMIFGMLRAFRVSPIAAILGVALFHLNNWITPQLIYDFWLVDGVAILSLIALILSIRLHNDWLFAVLLAFGVTVKESVLFAVPLYYSLNAEQLLDRKLVLRTLMLALPALAIFAGIRLMIPALNSPAYSATLPGPGEWWNHWILTSPYSYPNMARGVLGERLSGLVPTSVSRLSWGAFGSSALLILLSRKNLIWLLRFAPLIILAYLQLALAQDTERLLVIALPAILLMEANGIEAIAHAIVRQVQEA